MAKQNPIKLSHQVQDEIKSAATTIASDGGKLSKLYQRFEEIYFMTATDKPKGLNVDDDEIKVTISPTGRNAVTGIKRLLDTSEVHISIQSEGKDIPESARIERGLKQMLEQSGLARRARIEKDLNLSATLFGPAIMGAESVDDMILTHKKMGKSAQVARLEKIRRYTPFLFRAMHPSQSFSRWGELGMSAHLRRYEMTGSAIQEMWGAVDLSANSKYFINDWQDWENRMVWIDGRDTLLAKPHKMPGISIAARFAGGSSLWDDADKYMQSFLYAHMKGEWDRRENLFFTYLFTALYMQGLPGPLVLVDPSSVDAGTNKLEIDFTGGVRKIFAKAQVSDYPVIDGDVLRLKDIMDSISADSTIYKQTLGQNIQGSTFSGLAMLSSAGQLPLEDPKEALTNCYRDEFEYVLCRIRDEGIQNDLIPPDIIPQYFTLTVTLKPVLPQDNLRNAQTASTLGERVSNDWLLENVLQVDDVPAMKRQMRKERLEMLMFQAMGADQALLQEWVATALGRKKPAPPQIKPDPASPEAQVPPAAPPEMQMAGQMQPAPMPGMEAMPATEPMPVGGTNGEVTQQ